MANEPNTLMNLQTYLTIWLLLS